MKILHTADWHLGSFRSPTIDGVNLRTEDTKRCLDELIRVAKEEKPDYSLISGDIFHTGKIPNDRCCNEIVTVTHYIRELSEVSKHVVVMRGTPNHDAQEPFNVLAEMFADFDNVDVISKPLVLKFDDANIALIPGFDAGEFRSKHPGLSKEQENVAFSNELGNIAIGLKAQCDSNKTSILMAHYTVPGCNAESSQTMMLTRFEPVITQETLHTANFDLVALGHIHRPQQIGNENWFYSGAINAINFNDEGQERGFYIHETGTLGEWHSTFYKTPIREFITIGLNDFDISLFNEGKADLVAKSQWEGLIEGKIVRVIYNCTEEDKKAFNDALLRKRLVDDGAFMVWDVTPNKIDEIANKKELASSTDPEENLVRYLEEKEVPEDKIQELVLKARPIISEAEAKMTSGINTGVFVPIEISVHNYRNYADETFNFEDITFCTINGQNGAGKSSLFMDAIIDCLYEEPREGRLKDENDRAMWLRNDAKVTEGWIKFTFKIGEKTYRVTRTRGRSKITLNISELVGLVWTNRSKEKVVDTQREILNILGMDSFTFKSCALIMQDQYGLFLQAKPEDRVKVLGNLLGLDVYQIMEKIADDKRHFNKSKNESLKKEIEVHRATIEEYGNPEEELATCESELARVEMLLKEKTAERDKQKLLLTHQQEALERRQKLIKSIMSLEQKKETTEENRASQQTIIEENQKILSYREEIEEGVAKYNALVEEEKTLSEEATLYSVKATELLDLDKQITENKSQLDELAGMLRSETSQKTLLEMSIDKEKIRAEASEYDKYYKLLQDMTDLQIKYNAAKGVSNEKLWKVNSAEEKIKQKLKALETKKADLEKRAELLENSGCSIADNSECRFLADAREAKAQLPLIENEISSYKESSEKELTELKSQLDELEKKADSVGFDSAKLYDYTIKVQKLSNAPNRLRELEEKENKIALISASIDNLQSNISECEKRLATVKLKASQVKEEESSYKDSYEKHELVSREILEKKIWLEKEKLLPVAEERCKAATMRLSELDTELAGIDAEIAEKQADADKEINATICVEELTRQVAGLDTDINAINERAKGWQMQIGAIQQKLERIEKLQDEIKNLTKNQLEYAAKTADYEALKIAFSQNGVPHQIIRTIIPQLSSTSNAILGQMTGGKMGVEFKLEKITRNKTEKVTLDIFINECGKATLPYLSKSGGEKVKASLSVILALAEIKSSSAGIQLGMLFIDEPPFLDGDGIQAYCDALETIQSRYKNIKIMAITHDPTMKARFPQNIDVIKTDNGSKVIY